MINWIKTRPLGEGGKPLDQYWNIFYIMMGIMALVGILSGIFTNRIKESMKSLEFYANGKETAHHSYIPFD